jgi:hypothetical protein
MQQYSAITNVTAHHREAPETYRLERRANEKWQLKDGLHNTNRTVHKDYYLKEIT